MQKIYSVGFYKLSQQKQLKTMEMNEAWPYIYNDI